MSKNQTTYACFVFCGGHFEFLIHAHGLLVLGLEPKVSLEVWDSQLLGGSDRSSKIIKCPSRLRAISVISVPDLALADRTRELKVQNGRHKNTNTHDKGSWIFYSYSMDVRAPCATT